MVKCDLWVKSCELRVTSYELKAWKHELEFKSASSNPRVTSLNPRVQIRELQSQIHELRVQIYDLEIQILELQVQVQVFKNHLINDTFKISLFPKTVSLKLVASSSGNSPFHFLLMIYCFTFPLFHGYGFSRKQSH